MSTALTISPTSLSQAEGDGGTTYFLYTVSRDGDLAGPTTVDFRVLGDGAAPATATDFVGNALPSGTVWFGGGEATKQIWIPVAGDTVAEATEGFIVALQNPTGATISTGTASGAIVSDDGQAAPTLSIQSARVIQAEGDGGSTPFVFTVTRSGDLSGSSSANWRVQGGGPAVDITDGVATGDDFTGGALPGGTVSFAPGQSTATITVNVAGDSAPETIDVFRVTLSDPVGATGGGETSAKITNDDGGELRWAAGPASQAEGTGGLTPFVFTLTRSADSKGEASVQWQVGASAGQAEASDFQGGAFPSGVATFAAGQTSVDVVVPVNGDAIAEPAERFFVTLSNSVNSFIPLGAGTVGRTIANDDDGSGGGSVLSISADQATQAEGNAGATAFIFTVARTGSLVGASSADWQVQATADDPHGPTDYAGADASDFVGGVLPSGRVTFADGQASAAITVQVQGDTTPEDSEDFIVRLANLSGADGGGYASSAILTDDGRAFTVSPTGISQAEGSSGPTAYTYTVSRSAGTAGPSSLDWRVNPRSTTDGSDFAGGVLPSGVLNFAADETSKQIQVLVAGDAVVESDEDFEVQLSNPVNGYLPFGQLGYGFIRNDDATSPTGGSVAGTSGDDVFTLSPTGTLTITGYDAAGQDALGIPTGSGGFQLAGYIGGGALTMIDASAWWNNISGAQVVRWVGDAAAVDSAAKVDGLLQAMPGNGGGGRLVIGYASDDARLTLYYDTDSANPGGTSVVAIVDNLADPHALTTGDFTVSSGGPGSGGSPGGGGVQTGPSQTGTSGDDVFMLSPNGSASISGYDAAGRDTLGIPTGSGDFSLAGYAGGPTLSVVDASAWWNNISGAQVVRWVGDPATVDSAAKVDGLLQAMPGDGGGGRLLIGYASDDAHLAVYYDSDPAGAGGASLVAVIGDLTDPHALTATDFQLFG